MRLACGAFYEAVEPGQFLDFSWAKIGALSHFTRGCLSCFFLPLAGILVHKAFDPAGRIHDFLFSRYKRMAL